MGCGDGTETCTASHYCVPAKACNDENGDGALTDFFVCKAPAASPLAVLNIMCGNGSSAAACDAATCCMPTKCSDTAGDGSNTTFDCAAEDQPLLRKSDMNVLCGGGTEICTAAMCCAAANGDDVMQNLK